MRWLALVCMYERLHSKDFFKKNMACNRSYVQTIAVQKQNMRWLAIVHMYKRLHPQKVLKKTWLAIICTCKWLQSTNFKTHMAWNISHVRTISLHKFKTNMMAWNHLYMQTIAVQKFKTNMAWNNLYMQTISLHKFNLKQIWLAIVKRYATIDTETWGGVTRAWSENLIQILFWCQSTVRHTVSIIITSGHSAMQPL